MLFVRCANSPASYSIYTPNYAANAPESDISLAKD